MHRSRLGATKIVPDAIKLPVLHQALGWEKWFPAFASISILWAFCFSVELYKIWYLWTAFVGALVGLAVLSSKYRIKPIWTDILPILAYYIWMAASALIAYDGGAAAIRTIIDIIFIPVFAIAYLAGANSAPRTISKLLVLTVVPLWLSGIYFQGPDGTRFGLDAYEVAPFLVPFAVLSVYRGSKLSIVALVGVLAFLVACQTKTPLGAGLIGLVLSSVWLAPNLLRLARVAVLSAALILLTAGVALQFEKPAEMAARTWSRITHEDVALGGQYVRGEAEDVQRKNINELSLQLLENYRPFGIGYQNFELAYARYYSGNPMPLHSTYATLVLELGLPGIALALIIILEALKRIYVGLAAISGEERDFWKALAVGLVVAAVLGAFHQVHQVPSSWTVLGLIFGAGSRLAGRASPAYI